MTKRRTVRRGGKEGDRGLGARPDEQRSGAGSPRLRAVSEDDRPRGFQPQRMRKLWHDVDRARGKLGLGGDTRAKASRSRRRATSWAGFAVGIVAGATAWMIDLPRTAPAALRATITVAAKPLSGARAFTPFALLATGAAWLRPVPVVGRLAAWVPVRPGSAAGSSPSRAR